MNTVPEYIKTASIHWMDRSGKSLFRFCEEVGFDAGQQWLRMLNGERAVSVKLLFRVQSFSGYSLDNLDPRYNRALKLLPELKNWRAKMGLSQSTCAEMLCISRSSFDTLETACTVTHCSFTAEKMVRIADLMDGTIPVSAKKVDKPPIEETVPPVRKRWDINKATDKEVIDCADKVWKYAMMGAKRRFRFREVERGLYVANGDSLDYLVDVRKTPFHFRAKIRLAEAVLCDRYIGEGGCLNG